MSITRFIVCSHDGLCVRLNITNCFWCGERNAVCSVCNSNADRIRASLSHTTAKRRARLIAAAELVRWVQKRRDEVPS